MPVSRWPARQSVATVLLAVLMLATGTTRKPFAPGARAAAGSGSSAGPRHCAFVALEDAGAVAILAGPPWRAVGRTPVASGPHNLEASRDGRYIAVTSPPSNTVTVIRSSDGKRVEGHALGYPHDLAFSTVGQASVGDGQAGRAADRAPCRPRESSARCRRPAGPTISPSPPPARSCG